jgi:hypothetical protein
MLLKEQLFEAAAETAELEKALSLALALAIEHQQELEELQRLRAEVKQLKGYPAGG